MLVNQIVGSITSGPRAVFAVFNTCHNKRRSTYYGHCETWVLNDPALFDHDQAKLKDKNVTCR